MMHHSSKTDTILKVLATILAAHFVIFPLIGPKAAALTPLVIVVTLVGSNVIHAVRRYGAKSTLIFFALTCVISWGYETSSILTGFPFGHYHYSDLLGPKLWLVPVLIMPAYFSMGYLSWTLAHILLDKFDDRFERRHVFIIPIVASFIMVMWDLTIDPARATIEKAWVWHDGGAYFGVPIVNFAGWFLCVYTIFQAFAWYYYKHGQSIETSSPFQQSHWTIPVYLYAAMMTDQIVNPFFNKSEELQSLDGHVWWTGDMRASLGLVAVFTMLFVSLLALLRTYEWGRRIAAKE